MTDARSKTAAPKPIPDLAADLDAGLRRLKLAAVRRTAPEVLHVAKTQRWTPEEMLRTLIEAELAARDASNARNRLKAAAFPVLKTLDSFDVATSSIPQATFDYLSSLEWVRAQHNLALIGPPGTGKSHTLIGLGNAAIAAGHKVRYFTAADLIDTLYRGLADNTVGKIIDTLLRADLLILDEIGFAPLDDTGTQLLFRLVAAAYERRSLAVASHWPFEQWGRFLPEHTTAASILDRLLHHATVVITDGDSYRMRTPRQTEVTAPEIAPHHPQGGGDFTWPPAATYRWPLTEGSPRTGNSSGAFAFPGSPTPNPSPSPFTSGHARAIHVESRLRPSDLEGRSGCPAGEAQPWVNRLDISDHHHSRGSVEDRGEDVQCRRILQARTSVPGMQTQHERRSFGVHEPGPHVAVVVIDGPLVANALCDRWF